MAEEQANQSKFINADVVIDERVTLKKRKVNGIWKAIVELADGRTIWLQACKNGIMLSSKDDFEPIVLA